MEWRPTPGQSAVIAGHRELLVTHDVPVWGVLEVGAERLAHHYRDTCVASLLSDDGQWLHPLGLSDPRPEVAGTLEALAGVRLTADFGVSAQVLTTGEPVLLAQVPPEVLRDGRPEFAEYISRFGIRSLLVVPLRARGRRLGHVAMMRGHSHRPYTTDDLRFVQMVGDWLAMALAAALVQDRALPPDEFLSPRTVEWQRGRRAP